jgi:hypothetical protein
LTRCQNQSNSNSQPLISVPSVTPSSSPSRPISTSNSPSSKNHQANRYSNNNTPVLPSYPPLPPSHSRPSSSSTDGNRSAEPFQSDQISVSDSRARRRLQLRRSNPLPTNDQQTDRDFLSKLSQNDTLQRRRRDQINNHLRQYQQLSSSDEHDAPPVRPSSDKSSPAVIVNIYIVYQTEQDLKMLSDTLLNV